MNNKIEQQNNEENVVKYRLLSCEWGTVFPNLYYYYYFVVVSTDEKNTDKPKNTPQRYP
jgi:hypothetical protein